jgi:hypothetical protein
MVREGGPSLAGKGAAEHVGFHRGSVCWLLLSPSYAKATEAVVAAPIRPFPEASPDVAAGLPKPFHPLVGFGAGRRFPVLPSLENRANLGFVEAPEGEFGPSGSDPQSLKSGGCGIGQART